MALTTRLNTTLLAAIAALLLALVALSIIGLTMASHNADADEHARRVAACDQIADRTDIYGDGLDNWTTCMGGGR